MEKQGTRYLPSSLTLNRLSRPGERRAQRVPLSDRDVDLVLVFLFLF